MRKKPPRPPSRRNASAKTPSFTREKKAPGKAHAPRGNLPEICVLTITAINEEGELIATPLQWDTRRAPPHIVVTESGRQPSVAPGDRVLAKMRKISSQLYHALIIRVLAAEQSIPVLGVFTATANGGIIEPISRKQKESFMVTNGDVNDARHGELVSGVTLPGIPSLSMSYARVTERLGRLDAPRAASLIAAHMHRLPSVFSAEALAEAEDAPPPVLTPEYTDLRHIPLVTIDGEDARDFDDAVFAEPDMDPANPGGWHIVVAIADVAHYVLPDSALDLEARERGNSVYFPDRVIPMLPERLSNGLCSLNPNEDRYCLAVHLWIDTHGTMRRYQFVRGIMRSAARLTYTQVQVMSEEWRVAGDKKNIFSPLIHNLFGAYAALAAERDKRGALDLDLPEYKIIFDASGNVATITPRERLEAHRLIECYMIAANVAAADMLLTRGSAGIYRVHEPPDEGKLDEVRQFLKLAGYNLQKGAVRAIHFNRILHQSEDSPQKPMIHMAILRAQMQAYYGTENLGHFGLSLQKYCHFTSPIRRYADLVVHRALIESLRHPEQRKGSSKKGKSSFAPLRMTQNKLAETALHISDTERRAMMAERDAGDRYKVSYMSRQLGNSFTGAISGLNEYGLFVTLTDNGVTGFIPVRNLGQDFFTYDKRHACFRGQRSKLVFHLGQTLIIRVQEANAITGSLIFTIEKGDDFQQNLISLKPHRHKRTSSRHTARKNHRKNK